MQFKKLEPLATEYFLASTALLVLVVWVAMGTAAYLGQSTDVIGKVVDAWLKSAAFVVGGMWALNRYFVLRTDVLQLRVDPAVEFVSDSAGGSPTHVMLCRLDVVNTGKALTPSYATFLQVEGLVSGSQPITYADIARWPENGTHRSASIEPGSWGAISIGIRIPQGTDVVRVYLELVFDGSRKWTWHRLFRVREVAR